MKKLARKTDKICLVCGEAFKGTAAAQTCGSACRSALARLKAANKRPDFILIAKSKGQKIPDLNAPKRLYFKKGQAKVTFKYPLESEEVVIMPMPKVLDGKKLENPKIDEPLQFEPPKELTLEQKLAHNDKINKEIEVVKKEPLPAGMMPRAHVLNKEMRIDDLKKQLI